MKQEGLAEIAGTGEGKTILISLPPSKELDRDQASGFWAEHLMTQKISESGEGKYEVMEQLMSLVRKLFFGLIGVP